MTRSRVITIHRGELLQIKRMIVQDGQKRGNLHGLLTESYQAVILIAFGGKEEERNSCEDYLSNGHALKKLGDWCVESNYTEDSDDLLVFYNDGEHKISSHGEAKLEILGGQSAFRLSESVRNMLPKTSERLDANLPIDLPQLQQWYDTDHGRSLMVEMYKRFRPESGFSIRGITRDTSSHDMTMEIQYDNGVVPVYFPNDFPIVKPTVENGVELTMSDIDESAQTDQVVQSFVHSLLKFLDRSGLSKKEKTTATDHESQECEPDADEPKVSPMQDHEASDTNVKNAAPQPPQDDAEDRNGVDEDGKGNDHDNDDEMQNSGQDTSPPDTGTSDVTSVIDNAKTTDSDLTEVKQPVTAHLNNEMEQDKDQHTEEKKGTGGTESIQNQKLEKEEQHQDKQEERHGDKQQEEQNQKVVHEINSSKGGINISHNDSASMQTPNPNENTNVDEISHDNLAEAEPCSGYVQDRTQNDVKPSCKGSGAEMLDRDQESYKKKAEAEELEVKSKNNLMLNVDINLNDDQEVDIGQKKSLKESQGNDSTKTTEEVLVHQDNDKDPKINTEYMDVDDDESWDNISVESMNTQL